MKTILAALFLALAVRAGAQTYSSFAPFCVYAKNVPVLATGCPADIATIPVVDQNGNPLPAGTRFQILGTTLVTSTGAAICESGGPVNCGFSVWDAAGGTGVNLISNFSADINVGQVAVVGPAVGGPTPYSTSSNLYLRQPSNSTHAAVMSVRLTIYLLP